MVVVVVVLAAVKTYGLPERRAEAVEMKRLITSVAEERALGVAEGFANAAGLVVCHVCV